MGEAAAATAAALDGCVCERMMTSLRFSALPSSEEGEGSPTERLMEEDSKESSGLKPPSRDNSSFTM